MKVAIAGYGIEGRSNYRYYAARGHEVVIVDERAELADIPPDAPTMLGPGVFTRLDDFDLVVRTAGLSPRKITSGVKVWSATNEFLQQCPAPVIGVTGSKGKGTTCSLITSILRAAGKTVHLVGNIGVPALDVLEKVQPDDIVVYEMSSFQLWDAQYSPHVATVLYIEPEHLDVHADVSEYVAAKASIVRHQASDDVVVYHATNEYVAEIVAQAQATKIPYQSEQSAHVQDGAFWYGEQRLCSVDELQLPGSHNLDNACAAIAATREWVQDGDSVAKGLAAFSGLPHRLKRVRTVDAVAYYDDSIATTPGSAIAALGAFTAPKVLILGGSGKGADFTELAGVARDSQVRMVLAIGSEAPKITAAMQAVDVPVRQLGEQTTMAEVVAVARDVAQSGDVVILSPACASFGMFTNYIDRGEQFIAAVAAL